MKFAIFDLNGCVAFFDHAKNPLDAIAKLVKEDDSYTGLDHNRVHELDSDEAARLQTWIDADQKTHLWPFDWRSL